mgnify:FL=1
MGSTNLSIEAVNIQNVTTLVRQAVKEKEMAVNQKDRDRFLKLLNPSRKQYIQEQKRWFDDAVRYIDPGSFRLEVLQITPGKEHQVHVWVEQSYKKEGQRYAVKYPLLFQETASGWKDSDVPFYYLSQDEVVVCYTDRHLLDPAAVASDAATRAIRLFERKFNWQPQERIVVKLYDDPELFRQSVKLSLPDWAAGWYEAGQSIKFIGDPKFSEEVLASGIVHEVTHQMVSELSGDNAAYWLQEGAAEYYQAHLLPGLKGGELAHQDVKREWTLKELEEKNLERLSGEEARQYYAQSYAWFRDLIKKHGEEKIGEVIALLAMQPAIDRDHTDKLSETNERTRVALQRVLGDFLDE